MKIRNWKQARFLMYVITIQVIFCITLILDIPVARQVLGFLYLLFIPGLALLMGFRLEKFNIVETIVFSVGISLAFLMFVGLLTNELGSSILISKPLSTEPLIIIINIAVIILCVIFCTKIKEDPKGMIPKDLRKSLLIVPYLVLPLLNIIGLMLTIAYKNNLLIILVIIVIALLLLLSPFSPKFSSYYPLAIVSIGSTLLLSISLASNYIFGHDTHLEYLISKETTNISYWNRNIFLKNFRAFTYNSMLSVTVLPTIFSNILNMEETWIFKVIYPLIFSLVPLVLYLLYERQWGKKIAFISVLFFMSNQVFFDFRFTVKQMIAELFYVLLFLVLFKKDMNHQSKWLILICFHFALTVSYYTMNYIFLFLIFSIWLCGKIFVKNKNKKINLLMIVYFSIFTFLWHTYIVAGTFDRLVLSLEYNFRNFFDELFNPQSRGEMVMSAVGATSPQSFLHQIGRIIFDITAVFISIGFITLLAKRKKEIFDPEYFLLTSINMVILASLILIPSLNFLRFDRMYHVSLLFLSPLFIFGGKTFFENIFNVLRLQEKKRESYSLILILTVLVTFFLFQTGFVYEVTRDPVPHSIPLSKYRMDDYTQTVTLGLVHENDFFGASWFSKHADVKNAQVYSDVKAAYQVLTSSMVNTIDDTVVVLSNTTVITDKSYIYLSRYNTISGILLYDVRWPINITYSISELSIFNSRVVSNNRIYSNGDCEIYYYEP